MGGVLISQIIDARMAWRVFDRCAKYRAASKLKNNKCIGLPGASAIAKLGWDKKQIVSMCIQFQSSHVFIPGRNCISNLNEMDEDYEDDGQNINIQVEQRSKYKILNAANKVKTQCSIKYVALALIMSLLLNGYWYLAWNWVVGNIQPMKAKFFNKYLKDPNYTQYELAIMKACMANILDHIYQFWQIEQNRKLFLNSTGGLIAFDEARKLMDQKKFKFPNIYSIPQLLVGSKNRETKAVKALSVQQC